MQPVLYSRRSCDHCQAVKRFLDSAGLTSRVTIRDVDTDRWARYELLRYWPSGGVPTLYYNGQWMPGDADSIIAALRSIFGVPAPRPAARVEVVTVRPAAGLSSVRSENPAAQARVVGPAALPSVAAYVSKSCGACARFLSLVASSEKLLRLVNVKIIDGNPKVLLEMHEMGALKTPTLVVNGKAYSGPAATSALIALA